MTLVLYFAVFCFMTVFTLSFSQSVKYELSISQRTSEFESHFYLSLLSKDDFCIGTPPQCEKIQFDPGASIPVVLGKSLADFNTRDAQYNPDNSKTYKQQQEELDYYEGQKMTKGYPSLDTIRFGPLFTNEYTFYLGLEWLKELHHSSIGLSILSLKEEERHYFINVLYQNKLINKRQYSIELYTANDNDKDNSDGHIKDDNKRDGLITFGDIEVNKRKYQELFTIGKESYYYVVRFYEVKELIVEPQSFKPLITIFKDFKVTFDESFGMIQIPSFLISAIKQNVLREMNCSLNEHDQKSNGYEYFLCAKDNNNINSNSNDEMGDVSFMFTGGKLTLRKEDLFIDYDENHFLFAIVFQKSFGEIRWIIGEPILKHYMLLRNYDDNKVIIYEKRSSQYNKIDMISSISTYISFILIVGVCINGFALFKEFR